MKSNAFQFKPHRCVCVIDISALVRLMAWRLICANPLSEPMLNQFTDMYVPTICYIYTPANVAYDSHRVLSSSLLWMSYTTELHLNSARNLTSTDKHTPKYWTNRGVILLITFLKEWYFLLKLYNQPVCIFHDNFHFHKKILLLSDLSPGMISRGNFEQRVPPSQMAVQIANAYMRFFEIF